ncbi:MAG: hypothetical protein R3A46_21555 [Thermomicrobiales bacterium]
MYARVVSAKANPERLKDASGLHNLGEALAENAAMQPGIRGFFGLVDRSTGQVMTVTLWATPQDLESSESSGYLRRQMARAEALLGGPVTRETYEVVAHGDPEDYHAG